MNFQTKAKTDKADEKFKAIQESVYENGKTVKDKTALKVTYRLLMFVLAGVGGWRIRIMALSRISKRY